MALISTLILADQNLFGVLAMGGIVPIMTKAFVIFMTPWKNVMIGAHFGIHGKNGRTHSSPLILC
jgi:hypothetical protein